VRQIEKHRRKVSKKGRKDERQRKEGGREGRKTMEGRMECNERKEGRQAKRSIIGCRRNSLMHTSSKMSLQ
jgi:hypothetical protein